MKNYLKRYTDWIFLILFVVVALVLLIQSNDVLYMAQQHSLFIQGTVFGRQCMGQIGGAIMWIGLLGTAMFHYPVLGIALLLIIWLINYLLIRQVFPLPEVWRWLWIIPLFALLASIVDVGYWLYYMKHPGYWVRESVGVMCVLLMLLADRGRKGRIATLLSVAAYPLIGWYTTLSLSLLIVRQLLRRDYKISILSFVALLLGPALIAKCYTNVQPGDAWFVHFPLFANWTCVGWSLTLPFVALVMALIILCVTSYFQPQKGGRLIPWVGVALVIIATIGVNRGNANFHAENRMYRAIKEYRWEEVLKEMKQASEGPTRQMVCCKNLALLHTDRLTQMFDYDNIGPSPVVSDTLPVHLAHTIAPLLYLYHGLANDATHWSIENSVEFGMSLDNLQILALAAIINGEPALTAKYLNMLSMAPFQTGFVRRYYPLVEHPEWITEYPELALMVELHGELSNLNMKDDGLCEWRIYKNFARVVGYKSRRAQELALVYAMMLKDYVCIWPQLYNYARFKKPNEIPMPVLEAAYLGCQLQPKEHPVEEFLFDKSLADRFKRLRERKHPANDHSYWWFYFYCTHAQTY